MTSTVPNIFAAALASSDDERAQLAEEPMQSLNGDSTSDGDRDDAHSDAPGGVRDDEEFVPLTDAHREVLDRRLGALERDPSAGSSWEEVRGRL